MKTKYHRIDIIIDSSTLVRQLKYANYGIVPLLSDRESSLKQSCVTMSQYRLETSIKTKVGGEMAQI